MLQLQRINTVKIRPEIFLVTLLICFTQNSLVNGDAIQYTNQVFDSQFFQSRDTRTIISSNNANVSILISNCTFECLSSSPSSIQNFQITQSESQQLSDTLFLIQNSAQVVIEKSTFRNCYLAQFGGIFKFQNSSVSITDTVFENNAAVYGGSIFSQNSSISFTNTNFTSNLAYEGGSVYLLGPNTINFSTVGVNKSYAFNSAGFLSSQYYFPPNIDYLAISSGVYTSIIQGSKLQMFQSIAKNNAAAFYLNNTNLQFQLSDSDINETYTSSSGGGKDLAEIFGISESKQVYLDKIKINLKLQYPSKVLKSLIQASSKKTIDLRISNSQIKLFDDQVIFNSNYDCQTMSSGSFVNFGSSIISAQNATITSLGNLFSKMPFQQTTAIFNLYNSSLSEDQTTFNEIASMNGSLNLCDKCGLVNSRNSIISNLISCTGASLIYYSRRRLNNKVPLRFKQVLLHSIQQRIKQLLSLIFFCVGALSSELQVAQALMAKMMIIALNKTRY